MLDALNPFAGKEYGLKPEYIKAENSDNLCDYFLKKNLQSYHHALRSMENDKEFNDIFKDDNDLKRVIYNYTHPPYDMRRKIVLCLYKYLAGSSLKKYPLKRI